jgi:hypothetical protein
MSENGLQMQDSNVSNDLSHEKRLNELLPLRLNGWVKFVAVLTIIYGVFVSFMIITAIIGVPVIIAGIRLIEAGDELEKMKALNDTGRITAAIGKINSHFMIIGIMYLVGMIVYALVIIGLIIFAASEIGNFEY